MTGLKGRVDADSHIIESNSICRYLYVPSGRSLSQRLKFTKNVSFEFFNVKQKIFFQISSF